MLTNRNLAVKDYEQLIEEAIAQIPLYTKEWTNYNPSDPGITILENLSAFCALQQSQINTVTEKVKWKLLGLVGFQPKKGEMALTYLLNPSAKYKSFVKGQKIYAQNVCYEFTEESEISGGIIEKIYLHTDEGLSNILDLIHGSVFPVGIELFNQEKEGESALYFCIRDFETIQGKAYIYINVREDYARNPMKPTDANPFANGVWEIFTDEGYQPIQVKDETCCFLQKGYVCFQIPNDINPIPVRKDKLYRIRYVVTEARYDILPKLDRILGLLTPIVQKDTRCVLLKDTYHKGMKISHYLLQKGYADVFVKEEDERYYCYHLDTPFYKKDDQRQANFIRDGKFSSELVLPVTAEGKEILIALRDETIMPYRELGRLYGYDEQKIVLPLQNVPNERVFGEELKLLVMEDTKDGQVVHVVEPEKQEDEEVYFTVQEEENTITIMDCGRYEGARIYLGSYVTYLGEHGNVLAGTEFHIPQDKEEYLSCGVGIAGHFRDSFEDVRKCFAEDIRHAATIVTANDCKQLIGEIPGLSIHKVNVEALPDGCTIAVVVKPNSKEEFPKISDIYKNAMMEFLDERRLLTTKISISQPVYIPIHVRLRVHVKKHYEDSESRINEGLKALLDGISSEIPFGALLSFREIHKEINKMDCVEDIMELELYTDRIYGAQRVGKDIQMPFNALYYPGTFKIDMIDVR